MGKELGYLDSVDRLLQDERINQHKYYQEAIRGAVRFDRLDVVNRLLQDPRVDPSFNNNLALTMAIDKDSLAIVTRLINLDY